MSCLESIFLPLAASALIVASSSAVASQSKKNPPPPPPAHAKVSVAGCDQRLRAQRFGDNCSLLAGPPQFVADLDDDGVDDLVIAARCKNPMADRNEYSFVVADPYNSFMGFGQVKVTSTFASDEPQRRGVSLLIVHGTGKDAWRAQTPKAKFLLINLPFKTLTVKKYEYKKRTILGIYMEEQGEGESTSSVLFWDGKKYHYEILGSDME